LCQSKDRQGKEGKGGFYATFVLARFWLGLFRKHWRASNQKGFIAQQELSILYNFGHGPYRFGGGCLW